MAKISREKLKALTSIADVKLSGTYRSIYEKFGARKGDYSDNYHCFLEHQHPGGVDATPSMGVSDENGMYNCFTCGCSGNLYTYWKEFLSEPGKQYHEFLMDDLNVEFVDYETGEDAASGDAIQAKELYSKMVNKMAKDTGKQHVVPDAVTDAVDKENSLDISELDSAVENLLNNDLAMKFLNDNRHLSKEHIIKYRIGLTDGKKGVKHSKQFVFPIISPDGLLSNLKLYNPMNTRMKWQFKYRGRDMYPSPVRNFAASQIFFFEGEPDTYCAIGFGIDGAITLGGASNTDPAKLIGKQLSKQYLNGKEVVICFDSDDTGKTNAIKLAKSIYADARQVKIVDLDKSDINPHGLDPEVVTSKKTNGIIKHKRVEKDFTDYMKKNGFDDVAIERFMELVKNTSAYTDNTDRSTTEVYKVTVAESRLPKYHSEYGGMEKRIQVIASVSDLDSAAYLYYDKIPVTCAFMGVEDIPKKCAYCSMVGAVGFDEDVVEFSMHKKVPKEHLKKINHVRVSEKDILETIEVSEKARVTKLKTLCGINSQCTQMRFMAGRPVKVLHAKLISDVTYHPKDSEDSVYDSDIDVDVFIEGIEVKSGKSYMFEGVQTTTPDGQYAAIYADKATPVSTSIESFSMTQDIHNELKVFKKGDGETVREALSRRYKEYGSEAKITGREDLFFMYDVAYFSSINFSNSLISDSVRKWVEVGIVGGSRCGKSVVAEFLVNKYRLGEYFSCSSAISRSGVLGGIAKQFNNKNKIAWGVLPKNDKGIVVMDEVANMSINLLSDMTPSRTSGRVEVEMVLSGKAYARTRKILISNPRDYEAVEGQPFEGFAAIKGVYERDEIIQRFDIMHYIKASDIDIKTFEHHYENVTSKFSDLQSRHLLMWSHSRKSDQYCWEGGMKDFNGYVTDAVGERLLDKYHEKTLLVGQESSVRVIRMAVSLASMMYSTPDDDFNKVLVKREHVDAIIELMDETYSHKNMRFDELSEQIRAKETLGNMRFMENIIKYVGVESIIREPNFTEKSIQQVFFDYLQRVADKNMFMVDASSDKRKQTGMPAFTAVHKLVQTLVARNCLSRNGSKFEKTNMFTTWLDRMRSIDESELSDILEYELDSREVRDNEQASSLLAKFKADKGIGKQAKK